MVPWWAEAFVKAINDCDNAIKTLKDNLTFDHNRFSEKEIVNRNVIKTAKKGVWQDFCSSIGRKEQLGVVWKMLKRMMGKDSTVPVLAYAVSNKEK